MNIEPVAYVRSPRVEPLDDNWGAVVSNIALDTTRFTAEVLMGLEDFSHLEVVYLFHLVPESKIETSARHPRNRANWSSVVIFSQRGKNRPNRLGVSVCRILKVEGTVLTLEGLDAIDGTPVLDLKPCMREFAPRGAFRQPEWATELMAGYYNE